MSFAKTILTDIPPDFICNNITPFMGEKIQIKYYIKNRIQELKQGKKIQMTDIYYTVAEEINMEPETVRQILRTIK